MYVFQSLIDEMLFLTSIGTHTPILAASKKRNVCVFMCQHVFYEDDLLKLMGMLILYELGDYLSSSATNNAKNWTAKCPTFGSFARKISKHKLFLPYLPREGRKLEA